MSAGLTARYWIEQIAGLPCSVEIASEFRFRASALRHSPLAVEKVLALEPALCAWAERLADKRYALFLGRGYRYPIALVGGSEAEGDFLYPRRGLSGRGRVASCRPVILRQPWRANMPTFSAHPPCRRD